MRKRVIGFALSAMLSALCVSTAAQQSTKVPRIGVFYPGTADAYSARVEAFRQGLRELGYVEGKNIMIEYRTRKKISINWLPN